MTPLPKINVGTNPNDGTGDPLRAAFQTANGGLESLDALQTAIGIPEGSDQMGDVENIPEGEGQNSLPEDTAKKRLDKHESRIFFAEQGGPGGGGSIALTDLGQDFDLSAATAAIRGTTFVNQATTAISSQYPLPGDGIWNVEVRRSSAVNGVSGFDIGGEQLDFFVTRHGGDDTARVYHATKGGGVMSPWLDAAGPVAPALLTQNERPATHFPGTGNGDWRILINGGYYSLEITSGGAPAGLYPYVPFSGTLRYTLHIDRLSATEGTITAFANHGTRQGGLIAPRAYRTSVTLDGTGEAWETSGRIWEPVGGISDVMATRSLGIAYAKNELWLKWGQSNATGADGAFNSVNQGDLELFGIDAPDPRLFEVSRGTASRPGQESADLNKPHIHRTTGADDSGGIGFGLSFGKKRLDMHQGIRKLCISNRAFAGTSLVGGPWDPAGAGGVRYNEAIEEAEAFLDLNPEFVFAGILWHQGESDISQSTANYNAALLRLIDDARARLRGGDTSVFICGTMVKQWREEPGNEGAANIDAAHRGIANIGRPRCSYVDLDDLDRISNDSIHFGRDDLRTIGRRIAVQADGEVDFSATAGLPVHRFQYDGRKFSDIYGDLGQILDQTYSDDADRGRVLDTNVDSVLAPFRVDGMLNSSAYTVAMWINPRTVGANNSYYSGGENTPGQVRAHFFTQTTISHGNFNETAANAGLGATPAIDTWTHIAVTYDGSQFQAYVNGATSGPAITNFATPLGFVSSGKLGGALTLSAFTMDCRFDDIVLAPYAMSATCIAELATS